jgi:aspartyl-tRNA(Asn)/glutamyl-tRNA(Gln) amidotransferase subunit C
MIDRSVVLHLAELAQLSLTAAEADALAHDLERIVAYVGELHALDLEGIEATTGITRDRTLRKDEPTPGLDHDEAMAQAPRVQEGCFVVPPFAGT